MAPNFFPGHFYDQLQNSIFLPQPPQRIISLVPSQTELLFDLGLGKKIVGVTKFCIHPKQEVKMKEIIGGTKNFNLDKIRQLKPDLVIGNKEENYPEGIAALQLEYPVWMSNIFSLQDALNMIGGIGLITDTDREAVIIQREIQTAFVALPAFSPIPTAYFIWRKPYMVAGHDTFINHIMGEAGLYNVFGQLSRYPVISPADLQKVNPALILLSTEPYPFREKHIQEIKEICPLAEVKFVDGELFSWPGSRLRHTPAYLRRLRQELASC